MVYCGKPSKGCQTCRDRKTRCDRKEPSCGQCIRANRPCPGYRSQLDLMFRNESDAVIGKAKAREKSKKSKTPPETQPQPQPETFEPVQELVHVKSPNTEISDIEDLSMFTIDTLNGVFVRATLTSHTLAPSLEERGLAYFSTLSPTWLRDARLLDEISNQSRPEEHLLASMSAVGLASFSNAIHAPEVMVRARKDYVHALQLTNTALRSPTEAKKDSTLFAVMILGIFETITGNNERSLVAWTEHINGAATLVKLRGRDQFKSAAGKSMFLQVTSSLLLSCVQRTVPIPQHILDLREEAAKYLDSENPGWRLSGVIIDFTIFRADVRERKIVGPKAVIEGALEIDRRFTEIFENLPDNWKYETIHTDKTPQLIWKGIYHVYKEKWMGHMYNGMRTCRIMLHEIVRDQLLAASTAMTPVFPISQMIVQGERSIAIMMEMQAEILASIPHSHPLIGSDSDTSALLEGSRTYFIIWPLYLVGAMDLTTEPIRQWAIARLRNIGETMGIRQALVVADHLDDRSHVLVWDTKPAPQPHWREQTAVSDNYEETEPVWEEGDYDNELMLEDYDDSAPMWETGQEFFQSQLEEIPDFNET